MSYKDKSWSELILTLLFAVISIPATVALQGLVIQKLWGWYVVPTFNLPQLSSMVAWGIGLLLGALRLKNSTKKDDRPEKASLQYVLEVWVALGFILLVGWIGTFFL